MNASLLQPAPLDSLGTAPAGVGNNPLNQSDNGGEPGFGSLLQQAYPAAGTAGGTPGETAAAATDVLEQFRSLPGAGKLLPLLQQLLDGAGEQGIDPRQILDQVEERLALLESTSGDLDAAGMLAAAMQQVLDRLSTTAAGSAARQAVPGTAAAMTAVTEPGRPGQPAAGPAGNDGADAAASSPGDVPADISGKAGAESAQASSGQRQAEMAGLMAALRQPGPGNKPVAESLRPVDGAAAAPLQQSPAPAVSSVAAATAMTLDVPLNQGDWDQALGERVQWMLGQKMSGAQIRLNPANLGPLEVRIQVQNDQATVQFSSSHAVVREALDAALPRLRDMLGASGVELVNVDISGQSFAQQRQEAGERGGVFGAETAGAESAVPERVMETPVAAMLARGRLDLFA